MAIGAWLNRRFPKQVTRASPFAPLLAVTMTVLICGSIVAVNASAVRSAGPKLLAAVVALHSGKPGCPLGGSEWNARVNGRMRILNRSCSQ